MVFVLGPALGLVHGATLLGLANDSRGTVFLQGGPTDLHHLLQLDLVPPQLADLLVLFRALLLLVWCVAGDVGLVAFLEETFQLQLALQGGRDGLTLS